MKTLFLSTLFCINSIVAFANPWDWDNRQDLRDSRDYMERQIKSAPPVSQAHRGYTYGR